MTLPDRIKIPPAFWLGVDRLNLRRSELLRAAALPVAAGQADAHLTTAQFFALWGGLEVLKGPDVGLALANALDGSVMPPSFLVGYHARDLRDALARVRRFKMLCAPEEMDVQTDGGTCHVTVSWPHGLAAVPMALTDATMASIINLASSGTGADIRPMRIERRGASRRAFSEHFKCPVRWHAQKDRLIFHASDLARPFQSYNHELLDLLDQSLQKQVEDLCPSTTLADQVRWLLRRSLTAGRPELHRIARDLTISERSLQRRLREEGHSFQSLLSGVRHVLACDYLLQSGLDISEVAYLLGYDDHGSFYRAFQKWEGMPPAKWRAAQAGTIASTIQ
ncbi:helix-turn-helix domain-containing protein [Yoonia sp.]|uniref:helix-turn-helix domain-containing protein n=1 Tax=Yoonia sp. TaxID=2212373 RepID=UPI00391BF49B